MHMDKPGNSFATINPTPKGSRADHNFRASSNTCRDQLPLANINPDLTSEVVSGLRQTQICEWSAVDSLNRPPDGARHLDDLICLVECPGPIEVVVGSRGSIERWSSNVRSLLPGSPGRPHFPPIEWMAP